MQADYSQFQRLQILRFQDLLDRLEQMGKIDKMGKMDFKDHQDKTLEMGLHAGYVASQQVGRWVVVQARRVAPLRAKGQGRSTLWEVVPQMEAPQMEEIQEPGLFPYTLL